MTMRPTMPVTLFTASYLAAAAALNAGWLRVFVLTLLFSQTAAVALFLLRPARIRARRMRRDARPAPAAASAGPERSRGWALTAALVDEARAIRPVPPSEHAGTADLAAGDVDDAMTFWALVEPESQTAVELFPSRVTAEVALADALARDPRRARGLSVVPLDFGALSSWALDRAGVSAGAVLDGPGAALERALAHAPGRVRGQG